METHKATDSTIPVGLAVGIYSALINKQLTDEQRAQVIANGFEELERRYPNLSNAATDQELKNTELKLSAQIEQLRAKTEHDVALIRKDIEQLRAKTEHDVALVRKDIEQLRRETKSDIELLRQETKKDIADKTSTIIKWTIGLFVAQTSLLLTFFTLVKV